MVRVKQCFCAAALANPALLDATLDTLKSVPSENGNFPCRILPVRTSQLVASGYSAPPVARQLTGTLCESVGYLGVVLWCPNMPLEALRARRPFNPKLLQPSKNNGFTYTIFLSNFGHAHFRNGAL
jgi:hypothetical protein